MSAKSQFLGTKEINGREVGFFTPPHNEPDFVWVEAYELARAFLPHDAAQRMVSHAQNFDRENRAAETAARGPKIVTVIPHAVAQGLCSAIDQLNGYVEKEDEEWGGGPVNTAYCVAAGHALRDFMPRMSFEGLIAAFHNQGGPNLRGLRREMEGEDA